MLSRYARAFTVNSQKLISVCGYSSCVKNNIVHSPFKNVKLPKVNLTEYFWEDLNKWPDHTAAVCGVTGRRYTFWQMRKMSSALAVNLRRRLRLKDGDCVAIFTYNIPEYPIAVLGILEAGCRVTTINHMYTSYEITKLLTLSEANVIITIEPLYETVKASLKEMKKDIPIVSIKVTKDATTPNGAINFEELTDSNNLDTSILKDVKVTSEDIAAVPYSSGTTGMPKGVELTHFNIIANIQQFNGEEVRQQIETTATQQDAILGVLPLFHIYAFTMLMMHKLRFGCRLVTLPKFELKSFLKAVTEERTGLIYAAPPIVLALTSSPDVKDEHFEPIRLLMSGAAPLPQPDAERLLRKSKKEIRFLQGYGMTELSPLATVMRNDEVDYVSVGYAIPNSEFKIVDSGDNALGPNEVGEILFRGPQVMKGYKNNPEATRSTITSDGWLRTGDLGSYDSRGALFIADRLKELIKVKGFQVPPAELESVLREHPDVFDAVVVGVKNERTGEAPKAFVVLKPSVKTKSEDIMEFVAKRVAPYKKLIGVDFIDAIPKSASGKILRKDIKAKYNL